MSAQVISWEYYTAAEALRGGDKRASFAITFAC
jgi:hypothetical protein